METKLIKRWTFEEGVALEVWQMSLGFTVRIRDLDADEMLPLCTIHKTLEAAMAKAEHEVASAGAI